MFWEFPSITKAAEFVKELAEWELQKVYTRKYISDLMSGAIDREFNVLYLLGLRVVKELKCYECWSRSFNGCACCDSDSDSDSDDSDSDSELESNGISRDKCNGCGRKFYGFGDGKCYMLCDECQTIFAEDPFGMWS